MLVRRNLHSGRLKYLFALLLVLFVSVICVAFSMTGNEDFDFARREILLRRIGHEILLQSGDSTSRVLPVRKVANNEYHIRFEKAFSFQPDSLVHITRRSLANDPLANDYVVNVLNCSDSSVAYGYAISGNKKDDIIACLGRKQPEACYLINIRFQAAVTHTAKNGYLLGSLALVALLGFIFFRPAQPRSVVPEKQSAIPEDPSTGSQDASSNIFPLGSMLFNAETRKLLINEKTIDLTKTETRVLHIFASAPNEVIERSRLQKEIWEDEGIIVGRSLDMFISKLRKKLEPDPYIKIAVIRGKGYKLEISPEEPKC
jgi:DNA-binding winged helix-turn-helix (wHTH) protein